MSIFRNILGQLPNTDFNLGMNSEVFYLELDSELTRISSGGTRATEHPMLLAVDQHKNPIAIGQAVLGMQQKVESKIQIIQPVNQFSVHSRWAIKAYLDQLINLDKESMMKQVLGRKSALVSLNHGLFPLHRTVIIEELQNLGVATSRVVSHSQACFYSLPAAVRQQPVAMIVISGSTTEVVLVDGGKIIASSVIPVGSRQISELMQDALIRQYQLAVSDSVVTQIKKSLPAKVSGLEKWKSLIRGKDVIQNLPTSTTINSKFIDGIFDDFYSELIEATKQMFAQISTQLLTHTLDKGIYVFGKDGQLPGLKSVLEEELNCEIFNLPGGDFILQGLRVLHQESQ